MATFPCCWEILCGTYSLFAECWLLCSFLVTKSTQEPETCTRITMWWSERILWCVCCLSPGWHGWPFSATETTVFYCWRLVKYAGFSLRILVAGERCNVTGENIILWMLEWKIFIGYRTSAGEFFRFTSFSPMQICFSFLPQWGAWSLARRICMWLNQKVHLIITSSLKALGYIWTIDHTFYGFTGMITHAEC